MKIPTDFKITVALAAVAFIIPTVMLIHGPRAQTNVPSINGNCNAVGNDNTLCNVYGPQRLTFSEKIADAIVSKMPNNKPVAINAVGSEADIGVAAQYRDYIQAHGHTIASFNIIGMLVPPPSKPVSIGENANSYSVTIDPGVLP